MPRYFFHLSTPEHYSLDEIGVEYPSVEAAYLGAHQAALDMSVDLLRDHVDPSRHAFDIVDQHGQMLFDLPFSEVTRPVDHVPPHSHLHAAILRNHSRAKRATSELMETFARTRSLLAAAQELLARSNRGGRGAG
jgi:Domain of unknown function (DUF6894)